MVVEARRECSLPQQLPEQSPQSSATTSLCDMIPNRTLHLDHVNPMCSKHARDSLLAMIKI
jgi:hypothetical protein